MRVLLIGGGGREHALAWRLAASPSVSALIAAPGNPGIAAHASLRAVNPEDPTAVAALAAAERADLVVVGPEAPLAAGAADALAEAGVPCFGPSAAAAQLETSKSFTKEICAACGAPTAASASFDDPAAARAHLAAVGAPIVVKADGLAAGKGVVVAETLAEAEAALDGAFEVPGGRVLIEEKMTGEEASLFALCDGTRLLSLGGAQDHKRAHDGDIGPNTGGMGAYAPAPVLTPAVERLAMETILQPVVDEMARRGAPFRGVLYAGLMIEAGRPRLVEFNVRFGDPEAQVVLRRLEGDFADALRAAATGDLSAARLAPAGPPVLGVVMASAGYPGPVSSGVALQGVAEAAAEPGVEVFIAGAKDDGAGLKTSGGRVLAVTAEGADLAEAQARAYAAAEKISFDGGWMRRDIGWRALG